MFKNTSETYAVFTEYNIGVGVTQKYFKFKTKQGKECKSSVVYVDNLNIGDTVWIKYSIDDTQIIEVLDKDYKRHLKR